MLSSPLDFGINTNETRRLENGITPLFLEYVCKKYDISHYAYDINDECFMKYYSKNQNHTARIYYANYDHWHMYLVSEKYTKSQVEKAKTADHSINTSLLESIERLMF